MFTLVRSVVYLSRYLCSTIFGFLDFAARGVKRMHFLYNVELSLLRSLTDVKVSGCARRCAGEYCIDLVLPLSKPPTSQMPDPENQFS